MMNLLLFLVEPASLLVLVQPQQSPRRPTRLPLLKYIEAECMIRSMSYYENRQRSFN